jgi:hypothetical protein
VFRSYLIAAFRNLARSKLYAAINIIGLAVGFAAAILIALYVREETSFDRVSDRPDLVDVCSGWWCCSMNRRLTVSVHAFSAARARPVKALRYE